jgi:tetrahedral aminopeptidase
VAAQTAGAGTRACALSVPVRYIHAPVGLARKDDIRNSIALVSAFLQHGAELLRG